MRSLIKKKDKKGIGGIIMFFGILFIIFILGFIVSIAVTLIDFTSDEITPIMEDLGMVNSVNMSEASGYTFGTVNILVQSLPWLVGFSFVAAILFSVLFAIFATNNPHPVFIGVYILMAFLVIIGAIFLSNIYQDIYTGDDEIATRLHEQTLTSYMILHSPVIMAVISIITGIYLFTRSSEMEGYVS